MDFLEIFRGLRVYIPIHLPAISLTFAISCQQAVINRHDTQKKRGLARKSRFFYRKALS